MQGLISRDSDVSTIGLLKVLGYHIGVSSGAWLVASWDDSVSAWIPIMYRGTAANSTDCTVGFNNLGSILDMSSNLFAFEVCIEANAFSSVTNMLEDIIEAPHDLSDITMFGRGPNAFEASAVEA